MAGDAAIEDRCPQVDVSGVISGTGIRAQPFAGTLSLACARPSLRDGLRLPAVFRRNLDTSALAALVEVKRSSSTASSSAADESDRSE